MKDKGYIVRKLFKKHTMAIMLFTLLVVMFFVNFINRPNVFASEQVANVACDVCVVNGDKTELVCSDKQMITSSENSMIDFSDVNVQLKAKSTLEFNYSIENITEEEKVFSLVLNRDFIKNFKIEYYVDDTLGGELDKFDYVLGALETVDIKVVVSIESIINDAFLNGSLEVKFESIGD